MERAWPKALLFIAFVALSQGQSTDPAATMAAPVATSTESVERVGGQLYFDYRGRFSLYCNDLASSDPSATIAWSKNGTELGQLQELRGHVVVEAEEGVERGVLRLAEPARYDDWGNYSCSVGGQQRTWNVHAKLIARLPADTNVVEGQKLKLSCKLIGLPASGVVWTYSNQSDNASLAVPVAEAFGERVSLKPNEQGVRDAELAINETQRADAGWYWCAPDSVGTAAVSRLRVKDMYAALWPFLGICAEVFVLCAIILVYEKRRTKPELDDSDTDNHDQKKS